VAVEKESVDSKLFDAEAEKRVLSAMMNSEECCIEALNDLINEHFYLPKHQFIFDMICSLYKNGVHASYFELIKEARRHSVFQGTNDFEELKEIAEFFIGEGNIDYWIKVLKDLYRLRNFQRFLQKNLHKVQKTNDAQQLLMDAEDELTNLVSLEMDETGDTPEELATYGLEEIERRRKRYLEAKAKGVVNLDGLDTGYQMLNNCCLGYKGGDLVILGARTGHGKTAWSMNLAATVAVLAKQPEPILYLNTEMSKQQIALRWASLLSTVEQQRIRHGNISEKEFLNISHGYNQLYNSKFYSVAVPKLTPEKCISIARKYKVQKDIKLLVVDYVGRMEKLSDNIQEFQMLEMIMRSLKTLAQTLEIAVVALVQLNNDGSLQGAKRMKNEADLMLKLEPISFEEANENSELQDLVANYWIRIDKNRDGPGGIDIPILFDKNTMIMSDPRSKEGGRVN